MILLAVLFGHGCDGDVGVVPDGGVGSDGAADAGLLVTPPDIVWLDEGVPPIALTPCAEGWREDTTRDVTECRPYPAGGAGTCAMGEAHFPGEPGCRPIGDACPDGDYATALPSDDRILYVKAGAAAGGDGSIGAPYATLSQINWLSVTTGTTVAIAKGTYEGRLPLRSGAHVVGACAAETILTGIDAVVSSVITVTSAGPPAVVENLSVVGARQEGIRVQDGYALDVRGVLVARADNVGIQLFGSGTVLTLDDVVIEDTVRRPGALSLGLAVQEGARAEGRRVIVGGTDGVGIASDGSGTEVVLGDVVVRGVGRATASGEGGYGLTVQRGGHIEASRLLVSDTHGIGILVSQETSLGVFSETIVERTTSPEANDAGIVVNGGGVLEASRLTLADNEVAGLFMLDSGSEATLSDAVIRDSLPDPRTGGSGRGMDIEHGPRLEASRVLVSGNREVGILVGGEGTSATLTDVVVRDMRPRDSFEDRGRGISIQAGSLLGATRLLLSRCREAGLSASGSGTAVTLSDVVIRDTLPEDRTLGYGRPLVAFEEARVDCERLVADGAHEIGVQSSHGAIVNLRDARISRIGRSACARATCRDSTFAYGVAAVSGVASVDRFEILDSAICGVFVGSAAAAGEGSPFEVEPALDLNAGLVTQSEIGACVQVAEYDFDRLETGVAYQENGINLETTMLPVPGFIGGTVVGGE